MPPRHRQHDDRSRGGNGREPQGGLIVLRQRARSMAFEKRKTYLDHIFFVGRETAGNPAGQRLLGRLEKLSDPGGRQPHGLDSKESFFHDEDLTACSYAWKPAQLRFVRGVAETLQSVHSRPVEQHEIRVSRASTCSASAPQYRWNTAR